MTLSVPHTLPWLSLSLFYLFVFSTQCLDFAGMYWRCATVDEQIIFFQTQQWRNNSENKVAILKYALKFLGEPNLANSQSVLLRFHRLIKLPVQCLYIKVKHNMSGQVEQYLASTYRSGTVTCSIFFRKWPCKIQNYISAEYFK